ncbi:MarR family winged helix-turn-helix transcriptional regulator [Leucobacter sp. NPDC058333]|uniref:MarR family winged helix-turn-helix transcriptional regulator n=1 Tax=Leucobacter sp. NPDC058333 TaxID=3346450 RepID=UPI00365EDA90
MSDSQTAPHQPTVLDRVLAIGQMLQHDMDRSFSDTGLSTSRTHLLWVLHHAGPSTQRSLATALQVSARNITGLVDAVEHHGYAARTAHPTDRRATLVTLTDLGRRTMQRMASEHEQLSRELVAGLAPDEADVLMRGLTHVEGVLARLIAEAANPAEVRS